MKKATYFYGIWCQNGIPFLAPYSAKTEPVLAPYSAKTELRFWHHMVPHGASWCQKVPKRGTQINAFCVSIELKSRKNFVIFF